jgi:hypothetical protein
MINYSINNRHHIIGAGVRAHGGMWPSSATNWWEAGGATGAVAVYQPKGAADYTASLVNLANPGTYNGTTTSAPSWAASTGWTFDGSTNHIATGVTPTNNQTWSLIVSASNVAPTGWDIIAGLHQDNLRSFGIQFFPDIPRTFYHNGGFVSVAPSPTAGVWAVAGASGYLDGTLKTSSISVGDQGAFTVSVYVGAGGPTTKNTPCNILAFALYNTALDAAQVAAVSVAMAAL